MMDNYEGFDNLNRLRAMSKSKAGTSGFSKLDLLALQMAVDVFELLVHADRKHDGNLEMYDVDDDKTPKMLCIGASDEHYGETCFECFIKAGKALRELNAK